MSSSDMASYTGLSQEPVMSVPPAYSHYVSYDLSRKPLTSGSIGSLQSSPQFGFSEPSEIWHEKLLSKQKTNRSLQIKFLIFIRYFPFYIRALAILMMAVSFSLILTAVIMYEKALKGSKSLESIPKNAPITDDRCTVLLSITGINLIISLIFLFVSSSSTKLRKSQHAMSIAFAIVGVIGFSTSMGACFYLNKETKLQNELWKWSCKNEKLGISSDALDFHTVCRNVSFGWQFGIIQASLELLTLVMAITAFLILKYGNFVQYGRIGRLI